MLRCFLVHSIGLSMLLVACSLIRHTHKDIGRRDFGQGDLGLERLERTDDMMRWLCDVTLMCRNSNEVLITMVPDKKACEH